MIKNAAEIIEKKEESVIEISKVVIGKKDYVRFNLWHSKRPLMIIATEFLGIGLLIGETSDILKIIKGHDVGLEKLITFSLPLGIVLSLISISISLALTVAMATKAFSSDESIRQEATIKFNTIGVEATYNSGNIIIKWNKVYKACESKYDLYVFLGRNRAIIIPKRLVTNGQIKGVKTLFVKHLPKKKLRLKSL